MQIVTDKGIGACIQLTIETYLKTIIFTVKKHKPLLKVSGVSRISFRAVQNIFGKVEVFAWCDAPCSAWQSHAFVWGIRGHAPPRKFLKMVQFGAFWRIFC